MFKYFFYTYVYQFIALFFESEQDAYTVNKHIEKKILGYTFYLKNILPEWVENFLNRKKTFFIDTILENADDEDNFVDLYDLTDFFLNPEKLELLQFPFLENFLQTPSLNKFFFFRKKNLLYYSI